VLEVPAHEYARGCGNSTINLRQAWFRYIYSWIRYLLFCTRRGAIRS
jgi:hypothetical protein